MRILLGLLTAALVSAGVAAGDCQRGFEAPELIVTDAVSSAAYGDFDEDGHVDVAYMTNVSLLTVALNREGVFEPQASHDTYNAMPAVRLVAASDIDHDGHLDLIFRGTYIYGVEFGDGHGQFGRVVVSHPMNEVELYTGDVNHDGVLDFIDFSISQKGTFYVMIGSRDGTYSGTVVTMPAMVGQITLAGDFDGDGFVDLANIGGGSSSGSSGAWIVRYGWGTADPAKFILTTTTVIGPSVFPSYFSALDLDGDGVAEIVTSTAGLFHVIRAKNRQPSLKSVALPGVPSSGIGHAFAADLNGDGLPDIVFGGVMFASGDGSMTAPLYYSFPGASGPAAADIDGDGLPDLAATQGYAGLPILYGKVFRAGVGGFRLAVSETTLVRRTETADVNRDGVDDLIIVNSSPGATAAILFGDGAGGFRTGPTVPAPGSNSQFTSVAAADFDGDGFADLAMSAGPTTSIVRFGDGTGDFGLPVTINVDQIIGRMRLGAGLPSALLALSGTSLVVVTISTGRAIALAPISGAPTGGAFVVDANGDGVDDIVVSDAAGELHVLVGPSPWKEIAVLGAANQFRAFAVLAADIDGDGRIDLVIQNESEYFIAYARADGYSIVRAFGGYGLLRSVAVADFDGDGRADIILTMDQNFVGSVEIMRNIGGGDFEAYSRTMISQAYTRSVVLDVNRDGWPDLVVPGAGGVQVLANICAPPIVRAVAVPSAATEGTGVKIIASMLVPSPVGLITIREGGAIVATGEPGPFMWTTPPLTAGTHTYSITYKDQYAAPSEVTLTVQAIRPPSRRRPSLP